jgi:hypothetical protein
MSYDLSLFHIEPNETIEQVLHKMELQALNPDSKHFEAKRDMLNDVTLRLIEENPVLETANIDLNGVRGVMLRITGGNGIQLFLGTDSASIKVPYWYKGEIVKEVFVEIWRYLQVIQDATNYVVYDPQLQRVLDVGKDFEAVLTTYRTTMGNVEEIAKKFFDNSAK